jgi:hypothetical protein
MVWHIFKKDWKLLWPFFLAVAAVQFIPAIIRVRLGLFGEDSTLSALALIAVAIAVMATAFLVTSIVQQDAIPGVRQDWLVRPVRRMDLLLAKAFFVLALVQGSTFAADVFQALASGFPWRQSLSVAAAHNIFLTLFIALPALAFASVTRNMTEAIIGGIVAFCGGIGIDILSILLHGREEGLSPTALTGIQWVKTYATLVLLLLGVSVVLAIQYFWRRTVAARWLTAIVVVLFMLCQYLPWKPAFAIEQRLSPNPGAGRSILVVFDPSQGKFQRPSGMTMSDEEIGKLREQGPRAKTDLFLPLHVSGLPSDAVLKADKSEIRLIGSGGEVAYSGTGEDLEIRKEGPSDPQATIYQELDIPDKLYSRLRNQPLHLEMHYSLTLFRLGSAYGIPALGGDQRMPGLGWCATQMDESGTAVELRCMQAGKGPSCATVFLENVSTGLRNPSLSACSPDYSPPLERNNADPISHFGVNLRFRDPSGLAHFPVDGPQLPKSQVVFRVYEPEDHFTRQLIIPAVTLQDWESK